MRGSADIAGMLDVRSRRVLFRCEIVRQDQPLELVRESALDFSHSKMCAARDPLFGTRFGCIFL